MRRLPLASDSAGDAGEQSKAPPVRPGGPCIVVAPLDETAATAFLVELLRELERIGAAATLVVETSSKSFVLPEPLRFAQARTIVVRTDGETLADAVRGSGPFVVVSFDAAASLESSLVVAITAGVVPFLTPRARAVRDRIDVMLEEPRPGFARWLARRLSDASGRV